MKTFRVLVTDETVRRGIGPQLIDAEDEEAAKVALATANKTTVERLDSSGINWWLVQEVE